MSRHSRLLAMMVELAFIEKPESSDRAFLKARGWIPLGKEAFTGLEGYGKMIDGKAVTVNEAEALSIEKDSGKAEGV